MNKLLCCFLAGLAVAGCASRPARPQPAVPPPFATVPAEPVVSVPVEAPASEPAEAGEAATGDESLPLEPSRFLVAEARERERAERELRAEPCRPTPGPLLKVIDKFQQQLYRTLCGAALWFDGLFGEEQHPAAAEDSSGRLEFSLAYSERDGAKFRTLFNARLRIPNLENKVEAFFGRDNDQEFVQGRNEGLALRPLFLNIDTEDHWVAGLGYGLPGSYKQKTDFRVGLSGGVRTPETFAQGRFRRNWFIGDKGLIHFREIAFWTNREGFGATSVLDFDRILSPTRMFRWGNIATNSQDTHAWSWRSAFLLYQNLGERKAIAYEAYVRGETQAEVPLNEYGARTIYRRGLKSRPWLYGEFVVGYSWPRWELDEERKGSAAVAVGLEVLFGRQ